MPGPPYIPRITSQTSYEGQMDIYRRREAKVIELRKKGIGYGLTKKKLNKDWWSACQIYTGIALTIILMLGCIAFATCTGMRLIF